MHISGSWYWDSLRGSGDLITHTPPVHFQFCCEPADFIYLIFWHLLVALLRIWPLSFRLLSKAVRVGWCCRLPPLKKPNCSIHMRTNKNSVVVFIWRIGTLNALQQNVSRPYSQAFLMQHMKWQWQCTDSEMNPYALWDLATDGHFNHPESSVHSVTERRVAHKS